MKQETKTYREGFETWYRSFRGCDFVHNGPDFPLLDCWVSACRWLTKHNGRGGADIYTMTADQLRERLILALAENDKFAARICELEDAANGRP